MIANQDKWTEVLEAIRPRISQDTFATWFEHIVFLGVEEDKVFLQVPNNFFYEYLAEHFGQMLQAEVDKVFGVIDVDIRVKEEAPVNMPVANEVKPTRPIFNSHLSDAYTFDNFVKGDANKLARSIAMTIATKPMQTAFNPFFLYGSSGVGKSHLVNAVGLKILENDPSKRVLYVSAHDFLIQYTDSVPKNKFNDFMYFYQSIDCLIVDDIHEISGKAKTQEALFNIFNHLQRNGRQIIFTSDKAPSKLEGFEERVSSRFVMGATAEILRPDEQLRRNILKAKIRKNQLNIPKNVVDYIATNVTDNVRDLEGVINSLLVQSILNDSEITLEMTERIVSRLVRFKAKVITPELVVSTTCKFYKITHKDMDSASRKANIVKARQIAMYLMQKHTNMSSTQIGLHIGRRDHTTVLHACRQVDIKIKTAPNYKEEIRAIEQEMTK
ncbi:MAG: chromosomal replication initiator protein DnaA [Prevotellaceae bacterium]|nr:chromosomal replication initiator protein DnaA [Prevotellaceae bacterium]